jgi:hypothetical protein
MSRTGALLFGLYRTFSYGLSLLIHTVTVIVSWRELLDPWGLAKVSSHLWHSTWPTWGGFIALFLIAWDTWTIERQSRALSRWIRQYHLNPRRGAGAPSTLEDCAKSA